MREISRKAQTLFRQDGYHHLLYYHKGSYITKVDWLMLLAFWLSRSGSWSDGNGKGTPVNTWMNSARAELHLFNILHGRIKCLPAASWQSERRKCKGSRGRRTLFWYPRLDWFRTLTTEPNPTPTQPGVPE
ncbi:hypothetical protein AVEN_133161-1 [Araneus ventricosus]|uniref:Uncharacterized protein n=1 Tax=Araneus ventricosus TaxID=182803 RepID=A0A4Y2JJG8_ARAVE|nr:hypothetical protein AVEN_133161-1 [Araneus ventricosus]